ncbi:MAG TPA: hypothetical protein EYH31_11110, partial [Anaerolineae bacterium]|nr:hypothetical protein [Anaerolineae bacterium]
MMRIKKYFVQDMSEALPLIRDELGPNAVILHSRPVPKGLRQLRSGRMEVVAAVDDELPPLTPQPAMDTMQITTSSNMSQIEEDIAEIRAALLKKR